MVSQNNAAAVAVIGAGPAGLFAARELAKNGCNVVIFNRNIKPGGLAEYGIYPEKYKLKDGLRAQFKQILACDQITYFGNVSIGDKSPLGLSDLQKMGFAAVLIACGAQGTKWLNLPGETLCGVYHAKTLVYHYNHLPPFAAMPIPIGKKVFVIGVGNVMTDIVRFLASQPQVEEITTIARRGPAEVKFDQRELEPVAPYLDAADFDREIARVTPVMESVGQDPRTSVKDIEEQLGRVEEHRKKPVWKIRFLYSPLAMLSNDGATVSALQLEENILEAQGNTTVAKGTGKKVEEPADTVVFAIGDRVDDNLGIPLRGNEYRIADSPHFPVDGTSFELMDESDPHRLDGVFVAGWSRKSSTGMAGVARKDGTNAARAIQAYLNGSDNFQSIDPLALEDELAVRGYRAVTMRSLMKLENAEKDMAQKQGLPEFKFDSDEEMLELMGL